MSNGEDRDILADAELAGEQYANDQITGSDYFMDWVRSQLLEASRLDPSTVLPLETKSDAMVIARNMLRQLEEDTKRGLDPREIASLIGVESTTHEDVKDFFKGFRSALDESRDWLADELLFQRRLQGGNSPDAAATIGPREMRDVSETHTGTLTPRQIQDFKNDYAEGYNDGQHRLSSESTTPGYTTGYRDGSRRNQPSPGRREPGRFQADLDAAVQAFMRGVGEARRRAQPLVDTKLYSVTWAGGRQGNLTDREAVDLVRQLRNDWAEAGRNGKLNIQVWYRDGSPVPYSDLERQFYPTGSPVPGRGGVSEAGRSDATKVKWVSNGYDDGSHASVGRYFLKTMPVGGNRFIWSVSKGTKIVAGSEVVDLTWHAGYKGDPSEHGARVAAELAMTLHRTRSSRARFSES